MRFMQRKVNRVGPNTLTVSLPAKWAKAHGIKKGDELELEEDGSRIHLSLKKNDRKKIALNINDAQFLRRYITSYYRRGFDEIELLCNQDIADQIRNTLIDSCLGYELIEQRKGSYLIKNISSELESEFDSLFKKVFLSTKLMFSDFCIAAGARRFDNLVQIAKIEQYNDKLIYFLERILSKKGYGSNFQLLEKKNTLVNLEHIADECRFLCTYVAENKIGVSEELLKFAKTIFLFFEKVFSLYFMQTKSAEFFASLRMTEDAIKREMLSLQNFQSKSKQAILTDKLFNIHNYLHHISELIF